MGEDGVAVDVSGARADEDGADLRQRLGELEAALRRRTEELEAARAAFEREVSERERTEQELRQSEEWFRLLYENTNDIVSILNPDGTLRFHSPSAVRITGYPDEEVIGRSTLERMHPDDLPRVKEALSQIATHPGQPVVVEFRYRHKAGHYIHVESVARTLSPNTAAEGVLVNSREITERVRAEQALRESEAQFRRMTENASDLVTILDGAGVIQYVGPAIERMFGYTQEEIVGRNSFEFIHPEDVPSTLAELQHVVEHPGATRTASFRFRHKEGHYLVCEATGKTLLDDSAEAGVVVNTRDITARQEAERIARETEARTRLIVDTALDAVVTMGSDGLITSWNAQAERAFGWTAEEAIGARMSALIIPERYRSAHEEGLRKYLSTGEGPVLNKRIEISALRRDGSEFPVELSVTPVQTESGLSFSGFVRDITERKEAEAELQAAKAAAEAANQAKSEFLSRMSHELRTPMNSILGFAQLLQRKPLPPDQQRSVDHMLKAGRHLLNLINEVLDISRIEANQLQLSLEPVQLKAAVSEAVSLIQPVANQMRRTIDVSGVGSCDRYVMADRQRLTQVLLNLLSNAVKYNVPDGHVRVRCSADVGEALWLHVEDTGPGLSVEQIERLFVPFERLGAERGSVEGTGLGLALSKRLVEAMGGAIAVESLEGRGCTFSVRLGIAESPLRRLERNGGAPGTRAAEEGPTATLLYIEDNLANLSLIETILAERPGVTLLSSLQGQLGLELAKEHRPDVILLDLHLPDLRGDEVLRRLKADDRTKEIPVVIISADATSGRVERLLEGGATAYLTKPLDVQHFLDTVDALIRETGRS